MCSSDLFYLLFISHLYEQDQNMSEVIKIKNLVNDNSVKVKVVQSLLGLTTDVHTTSTLLLGVDDEATDKLYAKVKAEEESLFAKEIEINALVSKTINSEKEIKKCKSETSIESIDSEIRAAKQKIELLESML